MVHVIPPDTPVRVGADGINRGTRLRRVMSTTAAAYRITVLVALCADGVASRMAAGRL